MLRENDTIWDGKEYKKRKKYKSKYFIDIKVEIYRLETLKARYEKSWNILVQLCSLQFGNKYNSIMIKQKEEYLSKIDTELEFWKQELEKERNKPQPSQKPLKRKIKKRTDIQVEEMVRHYIELVKENPELSVYAGCFGIAKENVAIQLQVPVSQVENVFRKLNREGILSQRIPIYAHDTNRNPIFDGRASGWASDYYKILIKEDKEES